MLKSRDSISEVVPAETLELPLANVSYVSLAAALGVTVDTLHTWVRAGKIIQPVYFGGRARWTVDQAKSIIREGTQAAGTYPPINSPRSRQLANLPPTVAHTLGHHQGTRKDKGKKKVAKPTTPKRKGGGK